MLPIQRTTFHPSYGPFPVLDKLQMEPKEGVTAFQITVSGDLHLRDTSLDPNGYGSVF